MLNSNHTPIPGFEGIYWATPDGQIWNGKKYLKTWKINSGYRTVSLRKDLKTHNKLVHRLVAKTFKDNPENKREVNHINGNKEDNRAVNLEWVTPRENKLHAYKTGLKVYNRPTLGLKLKPRADDGRPRSKYRYVFFDPRRNKWVTSIFFQGRTLGQKRFDTEVEAAEHINRVMDDLGIMDRPRNVIS